MNNSYKTNSESSKIAKELETNNIPQRNDWSNKEKKALELINQGKRDKAEEIYRQLIAAGSTNQIVYSNLAALCRIRGKTNEMIMLLKEAVKINPAFPEAHNNLGNALKAQGSLNAAISSFQTALKLNPKFPQAHYNLGNALTEQGDLKAAIASFQKALQVNPHYPEAHNNLGNALKAQGDLSSAMKSYQKALQLNPNYPEAHNNLGNMLKEEGDLKAAIASFQKALQLNPNFPEAHWNLSHVQLLSGDYKSGWQNYHWRWQTTPPNQLHCNKPPIPQWEGESIQPGEQLLVISEQGLGDTMQYMRYIPYLRSQGIDVLFCAQRKLHKLIKESGIDAQPLTPDQASSISQGKWIPLLSLPRYLKITPTNPIISKPYISAKDEQINKWREILAQEKKPIIGINWQGNPEMEKTGYQGRSILLENFSQLINDNNVQLLSLQKGFGSEQLQSCSFKKNFVSCQASIDNCWDFLENAAIIANCDLIITCDTSIAHMAGGMGRKVWLLLRNIPYWTWGMYGSKTFWYPSMRLFRQEEKKNWQKVIEKVSLELKKEFKRDYE